MRLTRRDVLTTASAGSAALASVLLSPPRAFAADEAIDIVERIVGRRAAMSDRVRLAMPAVFQTGSTVPMDIEVDSPMTDGDHVRRIRVFAPLNPIVEVASFHFTPRRSVARISTRIRLAKPQDVVAVSEMNDGALLMNMTWVDVATDGCT